jgi:hypothetical protein
MHVLFCEEGQQGCLDVAPTSPPASSLPWPEWSARTATATEAADRRAEAATLSAEAGPFVIAHIDSLHYHYL